MPEFTKIETDIAATDKGLPYLTLWGTTVEHIRIRLNADAPYRMVLPVWAAIACAEHTARHLHKADLRRDGRPYVDHLRRVAQRAGTFTWQNMQPDFGDLGGVPVAIAWLHDSIEDHSYAMNTRRMYDMGLCSQIVDGVCAITKRPGENYDDYIYRVASDPYAWVTKLFDMMDNATDAPTPQALERYKRAAAHIVSRRVLGMQYETELINELEKAGLK